MFLAEMQLLFLRYFPFFITQNRLCKNFISSIFRLMETRWYLKRNVLSSSTCVDTNSGMQVNAADEFRMGRNAHPEFHY